jgi:hypothetical protein
MSWPRDRGDPRQEAGDRQHVKDVTPDQGTITVARPSKIPTNAVPLNWRRMLAPTGAGRSVDEIFGRPKKLVESLWICEL